MSKVLIKAEKAKLYTQLKNIGALDDASYGKYISRLTKPTTRQQLTPADINVIFQYVQAPNLAQLPNNVLQVVQDYSFQTRTGKFVIKAPKKKETILDGGPLDRKIRGLLRQLRFALRMKSAAPQSFNAEKLQAQAAVAASQRQNSLSYAINRLAARIIKYGDESTAQVEQRIKSRIIAGATRISDSVAAKFSINDNNNTSFKESLSARDTQAILTKQQVYANDRSSFSQRHKSQSSQTVYDPTQIASIANQLASGTFNFENVQNIQRTQQFLQPNLRQPVIQGIVNNQNPNSMDNEIQRSNPVIQSQITALQNALNASNRSLQSQQLEEEQEESKDNSYTRIPRSLQQSNQFDALNKSFEKPTKSKSISKPPKPAVIVPTKKPGPGVIGTFGKALKSMNPFG